MQVTTRLAYIAVVIILAFGLKNFILLLKSLYWNIKSV